MPETDMSEQRLAEIASSAIARGSIGLDVTYELIAACRSLKADFDAEVQNNLAVQADLNARLEAAEKERDEARKAINDFGNNPNGFDWAFLSRMDELETKLEAAEAQVGRLRNALQRAVDTYDHHGDCIRGADLQVMRAALQSPPAVEVQGRELNSPMNKGTM